MAQDQVHEIAILRHHDRAVLSGREEDPGVLGVSQTEIANSGSVNPLRRGQPLRDGRRQLGIDPDLHAARIG
jgi:hypothetical protein